MSSGSFPPERTKCPLRGCCGCLLQQTFTPFSVAAFFFSSFSFTLLRKSSRQRECLICSMRRLMRFWMILFLQCPPKRASHTWKLRPHFLIPNLFVDYDSDCSFGDIEDSSCLPMVILVRHSFLKSTITLK